MHGDELGTDEGLRHVDVGTARLAVRDTRRPADDARPALIALHAGVADSRSWDACVPAWMADGWRVITVDRRGYGRSTWEAAPFGHVEDLLAVMDALDVHSAVLVGNSMGGRVALETVLAAPDAVDGLVLIGAAVNGAPYPYGDPAPDEEELDEAAEAAGERGDVEEANRLEAHLWLDGPREPEGRVADPARQRFLDMNAIALSAPAVGEAQWPSAVAGSVWDRAAEITAPTLVVIGRHDMTLINAWSRGLVDRLPDAELVELPDSAHLPSLDDPDALVAATRTFLARVGTG